MTKYDLTRRTALAGIGASAALATSGAHAATTTTTRTVDLAWPTYHHLAATNAAPDIGEELTLRREDTPRGHEFAVSVRSKAGRRLGYLPAAEAKRSLVALNRGNTLQARVLERTDQPMPGMTGWSVLRIALSEGAFA